MGFAYGVLSLKPDEFHRLTWAEYEVMCEGYSQEKVRCHQQEWEKARWMVFHLLNIHLEKKHKMRRLGDLIRFPWDAPPRIEGNTRERFEELCKLWGSKIER